MTTLWANLVLIATCMFKAVAASSAPMAIAPVVCPATVSVKLPVLGVPATVSARLSDCTSCTTLSRSTVTGPTTAGAEASLLASERLFSTSVFTRPLTTLPSNVIVRPVTVLASPVTVTAPRPSAVAALSAAATTVLRLAATAGIVITTEPVLAAAPAVATL